MEYIHNNKNALIVLHEIYGVNEFIKDVCTRYHRIGFDVYSPNLLNKESYSYEQAADAYSNFMNEIGFHVYEQINALVNILKEKYDKVLILGFSVGATIAWRCSENSMCDGVIACYGSRIRDYLEVKPSCQVLLIFTDEDNYNVEIVMKQLIHIKGVNIKKMEAHHGFLDTYSKYYHREEAMKVFCYIEEFLEKITNMKRW